jgi:hypothetical protein
MPFYLMGKMRICPGPSDFMCPQSTSDGTMYLYFPNYSRISADDICGRESGQFSLAMGYEMGDSGIGIQFFVGVRDSLLHRVQTGSGAHPASYPMGTGSSDSGAKIYTCISPMCFRGVYLIKHRGNFVFILYLRTSIMCHKFAIITPDATKMQMVKLLLKLFPYRSLLLI